MMMRIRTARADSSWNIEFSNYFLSPYTFLQHFSGTLQHYRLVGVALRKWIRRTRLTSTTQKCISQNQHKPKPEPPFRHWIARVSSSLQPGFICPSKIKVRNSTQMRQNFIARIALSDYWEWLSLNFNFL